MTTFELSDTTCTYRTLADTLRDDAKTFSLTNVKIEGSEDDMRLLFRNVRGHPAMEVFSLKNVSTVDPNATLDLIVSSVLISASNIRSLHVENTPLKSSTIATVAYCDSIQSLSIPKNGYTDADAIVIADALTSSSSTLSSRLHSLDLSGNELSDVGGQYLERLLEKNTNIRSLRLNDNKNMSRDEYAKISAKLVGRTASAA
ncbi:hypothetical protein ACA910_007611 [Epithemia clementina (nom. ined.)]